MILPIFIFIFFVIFLNVKILFFEKKSKTFFKDYISNELDANNTTKSKNYEDFFIYPNVSNLPFNNHANIKKLYCLENKILKFSKNCMIKFDKHFSNTELKKLFGSNNLKDIIIFENNFYEFIVLLNEYYKELVYYNHIEDAKKVLLYCDDLQASQK